MLVVGQRHFAGVRQFRTKITVALFKGIGVVVIDERIEGLIAGALNPVAVRSRHSEVFAHRGCHTEAWKQLLQAAAFGGIQGKRTAYGGVVFVAQACVGFPVFIGITCIDICCAGMLRVDKMVGLLRITDPFATGFIPRSQVVVNIGVAVFCTSLHF